MVITWIVRFPIAPLPDWPFCGALGAVAPLQEGVEQAFTSEVDSRLSGRVNFFAFYPPIPAEWDGRSF